MREIIMTPGSIAMLALLATWAVWACRRMTRRGLCDCSDKCGDGCGGCCSGSAGCSCPAAEKMAADLEKALR